MKICKHTIKKLAKIVGIKRLEKEAINEIENLIFEYASKIAKISIELAKNAKRKTIKKEDIMIAKIG